MPTRPTGKIPKSDIAGQLPELPASFDAIWESMKTDIDALADASTDEQTKLRAALEDYAYLAAWRLMDPASSPRIDREISFTLTTVKMIGAKLSLDLATITHRHAEAATKAAMDRAFRLLAKVTLAALG